MGQTEAPLTIRPFLPEVTRSELMTIMTSGMAHVSGGMMAAYIAYGVEARASARRRDHDRARHHPASPKCSCRKPRSRSPRARVEMAEMRATDVNVLGADCARHHRRPASGAQRRGHADFIHRADRIWSTACFGGIHNLLARHGLVSFQPAADFRLGFCAGGVGDRRAVARLPRDRQPAGHAHGAQRTGGVLSGSVR